jgi:hypothetical protein
MTFFIGLLVFVLLSSLLLVWWSTVTCISRGGLNEWLYTEEIYRLHVSLSWLPSVASLFFFADVRDRFPPAFFSFFHALLLASPYIHPSPQALYWQTTSSAISFSLSTL